MTPISKIQRERFIYTKIKEHLNVHIYMHKARHVSKSKTICVTFLFTKIPTLYVTRFLMKFLKLAFIYIQKARLFSLLDVFLYQRPNTSKKVRQFALRFLIHKNLTLCVTRFSWNF